MRRLSRLVALAASTVVTAACSSYPASAPTAPGPTAAEPAPAPGPSLPQAALTARYRVVFDSTWSASTHPTDFPDTAHYSGLIGGTHSSAISFWQEGSVASEGIRQMSERGRKSPLDTEVQHGIATGLAQYLLSGPELAATPGSASMEFDVSQTHPLVTLVTMVAPSPDWFVGVSGLALFQNGQWRDEVRVELAGFDAGTDSGATYRSADRETIPRAVISRLAGYPVELAGVVRPVGTFTFTKIQ